MITALNAATNYTVGGLPKSCPLLGQNSSLCQESIVFGLEESGT